MATLHAHTQRVPVQRALSWPHPGFFTPAVKAPRARVTLQANCCFTSTAPRHIHTSRPVQHAPAHPSGIPRPGRKQVVVRANWGAPVEFKPAKVVSNKLAAPGLHQIFVDVGQAIAADYKKAGQYIQAKTANDAKAGFFAIASGPDPNNQGVLELLIKLQPGATAETLCGLKAGDEVLVSPVQGKGFPVERIPASDFPTVLMFATGSGISPIKAVIESGVLEADKRKKVKLYYGTKSADATAYQSLVPQWSKQGVEVVQVYSGDDKKYVQNIFEKDVDSLSDPTKVGVLLCGQKDMCNAVTELCKKKGVAEIMLNF